MAVADATVDKPETLGSFLRQARLDQGLDLTAIAEETRIARKNLIAIEEDNRLGLPADVFGRGFVRLYAVYLKLDPQEALRRYDRQWGASTPFATTTIPSARAEAAPCLTWSGLGIIIVLFALVIGGRIFSPSPVEGSGAYGYAVGEATAATGTTGEGTSSHRP